MNFSKLVPEIYYADINDGLKLFVNCLEFTISHSELNSGAPFCVLAKGDITVMMFENKEYANKFNPLLRLITKEIESVHQHVKSKFPELLHPNLPEVTLRPWGAKEFALRDNQLGIVIQQW